LLLREGIAQALFNEADGQMRHVDADPFATQLFSRMNGGAADSRRSKKPSQLAFQIYSWQRTLSA
jgi:hypothetical protein